jgi:hypothetical protein
VPRGVPGTFRFEIVNYLVFASVMAFVRIALRCIYPFERYWREASVHSSIGSSD